jgi:hypothetical protein
MPDTNTLMPGFPAGLKNPDGVATSIARIGNQLDRITSDLHGNLYEAALRGNLFHASSQAATTTTIALATAYTGFCLSNPAASAKNLEIRRVGVALTVAPAGIASISLAGGWLAAGVTAHTTPLVVYDNILANALSSVAVAKADGAATLVGTPRDIMQLMGGFTAGALPAFGGGTFDIAGGIIVPPGGYVFVETLTVTVGMFSMWWSEWPI